jgi:hypothetical protein
MSWKKYIKLPNFLRVSSKEVNEFLKLFEWNNGTILEEGCGYKNITKNIENLGGRVITLDIEKAYKPDVIADARFLPFKDRSINYLITDGLLEHFENKDLAKILSEEQRVFNHIIINIIPTNSWWNRILEHFQGTPKVYWRDKIEWQFIFAVAVKSSMKNFIVGTTYLKRLNIFTIMPFITVE